MVDESGFKIESSSMMRGSRRVLVKLLLFQCDGRGHTQDVATPSVFPDSKNSIIGLSNEVSVSGIFLKGGQSVSILVTWRPKTYGLPRKVHIEWLLPSIGRLVGVLTHMIAWV